MNWLNRIWQAIRTRLGLAAAGGVGGAGAAQAFDWGAALEIGLTVLSIVLCFIWGWEAIEKIRTKRAVRRAVEDGVTADESAAIKEALE